MIYIFFILIGMIAGMILMSALCVNKVKDLEEDLHTQILLRKNRDKFIDKQFKEHMKLKEQIINLNNNIEFLVNNLSAQKKKLVRPDNQD